MESIIYDFAIVGTGAAGLHLALAISEDPFFGDKKILLIDKSTKTINDKTWCYWEKGNGKWDHITHHSWDTTFFITNAQELQLPLGDYQYKMIRSIDFYSHAKKQLGGKKNLDWVHDEVLAITPEKPAIIVAGKNQYLAHHIFDSRIDPDFYQVNDPSIRLLQHFKGWVIETATDYFDPSAFTIMDFRLKYPDSTSFMYVLPFTKRKALIEFTFFSPELVDESIYDQYLEKYLKHVLRIDHYHIKETEQGIIPMTNYPFHQLNNDRVTKIGTGGSWVKGSSGYSFKNSERYSQQIITNIKKGQPPAKHLLRKRFMTYDTFFLDVLYCQNELGEQVFTDMYHKNKIGQIFRFLDEETTFQEEVKIISSFEWRPFLRALWRNLFR